MIMVDQLFSALFHSHALRVLVTVFLELGLQNRHFLLHTRIPSVLDRVVCSALKELGNLGPLFAIPVMVKE